jgi:hypothetical protein
MLQISPVLKFPKRSSMGAVAIKKTRMSIDLKIGKPVLPRKPSAPRSNEVALSEAGSYVEPCSEHDRGST